MKVDVSELVNAFKAAKAAAAAAATEDDGGTCNFDSAAFKLPGVRLATIEHAAALAGVSVCDFHWFGSRWYWLSGVYQGQGNCRSRMASAATKALKEAAPVGMDVCCYRQMD